MAAIQSLRDALGALRRQPVVFVGGVALAAVLLPQNALSQFGVPILPQLLQVLTFFITPLLLAGIVAMASEALDGSTSLGTLTARGRDHYVQLLLGKLIEFGIYVLWFVLLAVFGILLAVVGIFVLGISTSVAAGGGLAGAVGIVGAIAAVVLLGIPVVLFLAVRVLIQLFPAAIVTEDVDAVEGYKRSVRTVRANPLSAVGLWVINAVVSFLIGSPLTLFVFYRLYQRLDSLQAAGSGAAPGLGTGAGMGALFSTSETVAIVAGTFLLTAVTRPFSLAYETAFYERVTDDGEVRTGADDETPTDDGGTETDSEHGGFEFDTARRPAESDDAGAADGESHRERDRR